MDLAYIKKLNGTYGKTLEESIIGEMVNEYNEANKNVITEFDVLINSDKAKSVKINGIDSKVLMEYKINKNTKDDNFIIEVKNYINKLKTGDILEYCNKDSNVKDHYICTSKSVTKRDSYDLNYVLHCNQTLQISKNTSYPCVIQNDSYGSKTSANNDIQLELDTKIKIIVQRNKDTDKVKQDYRFIFSNSEDDIYRVVSINKSVSQGLITYICQIDKYMEGLDDLATNVAYQPYNKTQIEILGNDEIKINTISEYNVIPKSNSTWSLDERTLNDKVAELIVMDGCAKIKALKGGKIIRLKCECNNQELIKNILTVVR